MFNDNFASTASQGAAIPGLAVDHDAELRIMTYNVRYFGHPSRGLTSTERAVRGIARAVTRLDPLPDVIALQEVETHSVRADFGRAGPARKPQLERLQDTLHAYLAEGGQARRYRAHYYPSHRYALPGQRALYTTGLAFLIADTVEVEESATASPHDITHRRLRAVARLKQTRICAHLRLRHRESGAAIDVYNTHLSLPQFLTWRSVAFTQRMGYGANQLHEIFAVLDYVQRTRRGESMVLMGDFNSLPGSLVYEHVLESGFADPFRTARDLREQAYRGFPSAGFMHLRMRLDYLFSSQDIHWLDFQDTHAFGTRDSGFHGLSDHAPTIGRMRLRARPADILSSTHPSSRTPAR